MRDLGKGGKKCMRKDGWSKENVTRKNMTRTGNYAAGRKNHESTPKKTRISEELGRYKCTVVASCSIVLRETEMLPWLK